MAIYRIGKIISMMRDALGITQEDMVYDREVKSLAEGQISFTL